MSEKEENYVKNWIKTLVTLLMMMLVLRAGYLGGEIIIKKIFNEKEKCDE